MKQIYFALLLMFSALAHLNAQLDCCTADQVLPGISTYTIPSVDGYGHLEDLDHCSCLATNEHDSYWFKFQCTHAGTLELAITAVGLGADYNFALFKDNCPCLLSSETTSCDSNSPADPAGPFLPTGIADHPEVNFGVTDPSEFQPTVTLEAETNYYILIDNVSDNGVGFTIEFAGTAEIGPTPLVAPPAPITGPANVCPNATVTYSVPPIPGGTYYWWSIDPSVAVIVAGQGTTDLTLTWTNPGNREVCVSAYTGCLSTTKTCFPVVNEPLPVPAGYATGEICINGIYETSNGYYYTQPGVYDVPYETQYGCDSIVRLSLTPLPIDFDVRLKTLCKGECVEFFGETYCESGLYEKVLTNQWGCDSTIWLNVVSFPNESIITGVDTLSCKNPSIVLDGSMSIGGTNLTYKWKKNNTVVGTGQTLTVTTPGSYTLETTSIVAPDTCVSEKTVVIISDSAQPQNVTATGGLISCGNPAITLFGNSSSANVNYQWTGPGGFNSTTQNPTVSVAGNYLLTVTGLNGCTKTATANVTGDSQPPTATASGGALSCPNPTVTLFGNSSATGAAYSWQGPGGIVLNEQNPVVTAAGNYTLTVTAPNGCTKTATANVTGSTTQPNAAANAGGVLNCDANTVVLNGGGSSTGSQFSYSWTTTGGNIVSGATSLTPTVDEAGTYVLLVTNNNNSCTNTAQTQVSQSPTVTAAIVEQTNILCFGQATGSVTVNTGGGAGGFTYAWSNSGTGATISGLIAGNYSVTVTDGEGCTATASATISQPTMLSGNAVATPQTISGVNNGTATANPTGGTGTYTYLWSNGATSAQLTGLAPDFYTVTVTDGNGCTDVQTVTVSASNCIVKANLDKEDVTCFGMADGQATLNLDNATPPFIFEWSNGDTTQTISNLSGGTYTVTATDAEGCAVVSSVNIAEPAVLTPNATATNLTAIGSNDGTASANPTGGTVEYTYEWSNGDSIATISNLAPGDYTVIITDENGCSETQTVTVSPFDCGLSANISAGDVSCNGGSDGQATVTTLGGTAPFTYQWSNDADTPTASDLAAGTYSVSVSDESDCLAIAEVTIGEPTALELGISEVINADCKVSNGAASVAATGGTPGYAFNWSTGEMSNSATDLSAGDYEVSVTDDNGCETVLTVTVGVNDITPPDVATQDITVELGATGAVLVAATEIDNGSSDSCGIASMTLDVSDFDCSNLGENEVTLTVTDIAGNTSTATAIVTVVDNTPPVVTLLDVSISLDENGTATLTLAMLDNGISDNCEVDSISFQPSTFTCDDLGDNPVEVTVTDASGNVSSSSAIVTIVDDEAPVFACPTDMALSYCDPVAVYDISITDNCADFLEPNQTSGLPSGSTFPEGETVVTYEVTDASGNLATCSFTVTVPVEMDVAVTPVNAACAGELDGSLSTTVSGGSPGYTYLWNTGATTPGLTNIGAGTYTVTVTDSKGCTEVQTSSVTAPTAVLTELVSVANETNNQENGSIDVTVSGGTSPYTYSWTDLAGNVIGTTQDISGLPAGTYQLQVTDANGCLSSSAYTIQSVITDTEEADLQRRIALYPNPTRGWVTLELSDLALSKLEVTAFDVVGRETFSYQSNGAVLHQLDFSTQPAGVYLLKIMIEGKVVTKRVVVSR